jgi:hypothetical protein
VDAADYVVWRNTVGGTELAADGNGDGLVDVADYNVWRARFGNTANLGGGAFMGLPGSASIPEPPTYALLLAVVVLAFRPRTNGGPQ